MSLSQYGGAAGIFGGLSKSATIGNPGVIAIRSGSTYLIWLWVSNSHNYGADTPPGICLWEQAVAKYRLNDGSFPLSPYAVGGNGIAGVQISPPQICRTNQSLELRFRLGTYDSATGDHAADGYFEVRVNGVVSLLVDHIALGLQGVPGWDNITFAPNGVVVASTNGGVDSVYVNDVDTYGASGSSLVNDVFTAMSDSDIFEDLNPASPWRRRTIASGGADAGSDAAASAPSFGVTPDTLNPRMVSGRLNGLGNAVIFQLNPLSPAALTPAVQPVPLPTPLASQTPCTPQATVSNGGKGQAGCNVGGVGGGHEFTGELGDVPDHPDPDDGEVLHGDPAAVFETWVEVDHVDYPSEDVTTYRRSFEELDDDGDYEGGRKESGLLSIGDIEHGLGNEQGGFEAASVDIQLSDIRDRLFRTLADDQDLEGDEVRIKGATDGARAAHTVARTLMRAIVQQASLESFLLAGLTATDWLFSDFGPFGPNRVDPNYTFNDLGAAAPQMTDDTKAQSIPLLYFEKSDEGAVDPITNLPASKGLLPGFYIGMFDLTGSTLPPSAARPGRTLAEAVALMQQLVDDDADDATWESTLGFDIGTNDIITLKAIGTVPDDYDRLANVIGYADLDEVLRHGTTAAPSGNFWGFIATGLGPWHEYRGVYGSDLGGGDPKKTHDRVKLDPLTRSDLMVPGINFPFAVPYFALTNPETGREFWLTGVWVRGPLLEDHLNGIVNMAFNAVGITANGDGTGGPIGRVEDAKQHRLENHWINRWSSGDYATDLVYPKFNDGTAMVRTSTFRTRQQFFKDRLGDEGLLVSWYTDKQRPNLEIVRDWNRETDSRLGVCQHGQIMDWGLDETVDPTTWPRVFHELDVFGPIVRTAGEERENLVIGVCDWDPDFEKFRAGPFQFQSAEGIKKNKRRVKQGDKIESKILDNPTHFQWILQRRLSRLQFGTTLINVPLRLDPYLNYDVGQGILFNSEDGTGADGYVDHPFIILRRRINIRERILTLTLWDVRDVLIETAFPGGLDQLFIATDDEDEAPLATDDLDLAPLAI